MTSPISVIVADGDPRLRGALARLISAEPELELVGSAADAHQAIEVAAATHPEAAVIDLLIPGGGSPRTAREIRRVSPRTRILPYSARARRTRPPYATGAAAAPQLDRSATFGEIVSALLLSARSRKRSGTAGSDDTGDELLRRRAQREGGEGESVALERRIQRTIDEERFDSLFQPIMELRTGRTIGVEASARFPEEPRRRPDEWFADAERVGLRGDLELAVARDAISQLDGISPPAFMAVKVSATTLPRCRALLDTPRSRRLVFKVGGQPERHTGAVPGLDMIRARGVRLAFAGGREGHGSLRDIAHLSPEFVKIDRSLTQRIDEDAGARERAAGVIGLARTFGAEVIAEGIESRAHLEALRALGVRFGQGHYLAAPRPLGSIFA
jgi:EAL domain-containing protein (putative c-di-GMP-specific phosphodiesterase class I)/DNA-binding NarL/FixJ family response regulator